MRFSIFDSTIHVELRIKDSATVKIAGTYHVRPRSKALGLKVEDQYLPLYDRLFKLSACQEDAAITVVCQ